ncbi:MAG: hypothetical protein LH660_12400 [Phormidesmis sp. CAN_BIN36]|nr:hypothetical protein [Phormidesmis sp. CAN_BIN36]
MKPEFALTLTLSQGAREQDFWLPSPWGEGLGMREIIVAFSNAKICRLSQ